MFNTKKNMFGNITTTIFLITLQIWPNPPFQNLLIFPLNP